MYEAYITTINEIHKHSNADRLQCCTIFGNNVIVDMSYHLGQRVVYFPVDGQLSEEYAKDNKLVREYVLASELESYDKAKVMVRNGVEYVNVGGYMDENKRNIVALKLRGEKSEGLVMPIETLAKYTNIDDLKDGDTITMLNGHEICRKYIPRGNNRQRTKSDSGGKKKKVKPKETVDYPFFEEHIDTKQLAFNKNAFRVGDTCYITLKMHGSSQRSMCAVQVTKRRRNLILRKVFKLGDKEIRQFKCVSGTRRTVLKDYDGGYYGSNAFREPYHEFFAQKLPKGMEVFYEVVGWVNENTTIMGRCSNAKVKDKAFRKMYGDETIFSYGCDVGQSDCYVYRMTMTNEDGFVVELPWEQVQIECEKMGVKCVPTFEKFTYTTWEDLMERVEKYYDGADPIGKTHIREGVVVRIDNRPTFTAFKHKNFMFKLISGIIVDSLSNEQAEGMDSDVLEEL